MCPADRIEQGAQVVVIEFVHERDQAAQFAGRKAFAREPAEIMPGQVGELAAFVLAISHLAGDEEGEFFRVHFCRKLVRVR